MEYLRAIWAARYFWTHLARADLRSKWRRSYLGVAWTLIQPLGMTILLAAVFGRIFKTPIGAYAPYILSGIVVWDFVSATTTAGSLAFVQADAYIKQCRHPLAIYTLRTVLANAMALGMASTALFAWAFLAFPDKIGLHTLAALTLFPILVMIGWPLATLLAYVATRFRDLPFALTLLLQVIWFVSPVYFEARIFRDARLDWLIDWNPVYHVLELVRAPLLNGQWPSGADFAFSIGTAVVFAAFAWAVGVRAERRVIFYL